MCKNEKGKDKVLPFSKRRKVIAERLTESNQLIPHFYLTVDVVMDELLDYRVTYNKKNEVKEKVSITDFIIKASALSLTEYEKINAHVKEDKVILKNDINIGVAVAVDEGLLVPVISNVDQKSIAEISNISKYNIKKAKDGIINAQEIGTFTITNLGMYSINFFLPIINPPESAILSIGSIEKKVVPVDNDIKVKQIMTLCLAADHRIVDGAYAAQFLNKIKFYLENIDYIKEGNVDE